MQGCGRGMERGVDMDMDEIVEDIDEVDADHAGGVRPSPRNPQLHSRASVGDPQPLSLRLFSVPRQHFIIYT